MKSMNQVSRTLFSAALVFGVAAVAQEKPKKLASSKDWALWESRIGTADVCYMQSSGGNGWFLTLRKNKNSVNSPLEVMIQRTSNKNAATGAVLSYAGLSSTMAFPDLDGAKANFVGIPKNLSSLLSLVAASSNNKIILTGVGGKKAEQEDVSTKGMADMVLKMQELCNGNAPLVQSEYESSFINAVSDQVDPLKIDVTKAGQIRGLFYGTYPSAVELTAARAELNQVLAKYQPALNELQSNRAAANKLANSDLPAARQDLANNQKTQRDSQAEISRVDAALPSLNAKVQASQKALDAAESVIAPLRPEYNRLTSQLSSAQNSLDSAESRLDYIENRLSQGANQIASLESEASMIERRLPQKRAELDRARQIYRDADFERSRYNPSMERDVRLRNNFEYSRLERDRRQLEMEMSRVRNEVENLRRERDRVQRDLNVCLSTPMVEQLVPGPSVGPDGDDGSGAGIVPGPSNPGGNPVPPQKDCSHLRNALNNANAQLNQKQNELRQIDNRIDNVDDRMRQIVRMIEMEVQREYQILVDRAEDARRRLDIAEDSVQDDENRRAQIRQSEIPRLEREQSELRAERPSVQSQISSSRADVNRLSNELARFKSANDWDRKEANVNSKSNQLRTDQNALDTAEASKARAQRDLQAALVRESQIKSQIDTLTAQLNALNQRAAQLEDTLRGLPSERAPIDAKIATLEATIKARKDQLLSILQ